MSRILKQSTARTVMVFMVDSADHITGRSGLTLTIQASKAGAAFSTISPSVTDRGNGWYSIALTGGHTDTLGDLALNITATGADPTDLVYLVAPGLPGEGGSGGGASGSHASSLPRVVRGQRVHRRLVSTATITSVSVYGPDRQIAKTCVFLYDPSTNVADVTFTPDEFGIWTVVGRDASSNVVATDNVECAGNLVEWSAYGLKPFEGLATSYPIQTIDEGEPVSGIGAGSDLAISSIATGGTFTTRAWISKGKVVIPYDCVIYGMRLMVSASSPLSNAVSWRLYTVAATGVSTGTVRSISDNVVSLTPVEGSWSGGGFKTVLFRKPVVGRFGDWWGFEMDDSVVGGTTIGAYYLPSRPNVITAGQSMDVLNAALNLSGSNTWGTFGGLTGQYQIQLLLSPPAIGIAGLSHWAGSGASPTGAASASIYTDHPVAPNRTRDLSFYLQEQVGLPCVNLAHGGTDIRNWVGPASYTHDIASGGATVNLQLATPYPPASDFTAGQRLRLQGGTTEYRKVSSYNATTGVLTLTGTNGTTHTSVTYTPVINGYTTGMWERVVVPLRPSLVVYDCVYNDCQAGYGREGVPGFESRDYLGMLDRLLVHADQSGIELAVLEAFGSRFAVLNDTVHGLDFSAQIEKLNRLARGWCERHGVLYIPLNWRLGQYEGTRASSRRYKRYNQKRFQIENPRWGLPNYEATDIVHLTEQGRKAAAMAIADRLKRRGGIWGVREDMDSYVDISPPQSPAIMWYNTDDATRKTFGLVGGYQVMRDCVYDTAGNLTGATIRVYDSTANADADDGSTGLLATWTVTNSYSGLNLATQKIR